MLAGNALLQREPGCSVSGNHLLAAIQSKENVMNKLRVLFTSLAAAVLCAPAVFAQGVVEAPPESHSALWIAAGIGMAIAAFGGALGQGRIAGAACEGIARNPGAAGNIRTAMLLGLVFVETLALLTFAIIFAKVK